MKAATSVCELIYDGVDARWGAVGVQLWGVDIRDPALAELGFLYFSIHLTPHIMVLVIFFCL